MANKLTLYFQHSTVGKQYKLDVTLDEILIGSLTFNQSDGRTTHNFMVENGLHTIRCTLHVLLSNKEWNTFDFDPIQFSTTDTNVEFTCNFYNIIQYELLEGNIPHDKDRFERDNPNKKPRGCYVATCVYGSYDCPEVWTLRRFRDDTLGSSWYGRAFIHTYYKISPTLVKWFGNTSWFKKMWRGTLDRMVAKLQARGFSDTPYQDKE